MRKASIALVAGLSLAAPTAVFAETAQRPVPVEITRTNAPVQAPVQETSSYAEREQASQQAGEFEGGQTVIVFSGAAVIALLLLLILI